MKRPSRKIRQHLKEQYPKGMRVRLVRMEDFQAPPIGTKGTVLGVDSMGSVMVAWDNGSRLSVVYGEDECQPLLTHTIQNQIKTLRTSGVLNMFDLRTVQRHANMVGFQALVAFIEEEPTAYREYIRTERWG